VVPSLIEWQLELKSAVRIVTAFAAVFLFNSRRQVSITAPVRLNLVETMFTQPLIAQAAIVPIPEAARKEIKSKRPFYMTASKTAN